jgi:hypothetical protein
VIHCRLTSHSTSQSQSYVTTDGQSASVSWNKTPICGLRPDFYYCLTVWQLRSCFCGAPSLTRGWVCLLYMLLVLASAVCLGSESLETRNHILLSQVWDFPFRCLLRLAASRWRYLTPPPHRCSHSTTATAATLYLLGIPNREHRVEKFSYSLSQKRHLRCVGNICLYCCENNDYRAVDQQPTVAAGHPRYAC